MKFFNRFSALSQKQKVHVRLGYIDVVVSVGPYYLLLTIIENCDHVNPQSPHWSDTAIRISPNNRSLTWDLTKSEHASKHIRNEFTANMTIPRYWMMPAKLAILSWVWIVNIRLSYNAIFFIPATFLMLFSWTFLAALADIR